MRIIAENLEQAYESAGRRLVALRDINFTIEPYEFVAIVGPSGSGKTTLLGLLAGLDRPSSGRVLLDGRDLGAMSEDERAAFRAANVGFVFQTFQLIPTLTALENVLVPLELKHDGQRADAERARALLERVGLGERLDHYPAQLSGGEQQRVALARAFANEPAVLFADEPTGNLDAENGAAVADLLVELNRERRTTLVLVTHDPKMAARAGRVIRLEGGRIVSDSGGAGGAVSRASAAGAASGARAGGAVAPANPGGAPAGAAPEEGAPAGGLAADETRFGGASAGGAPEGGAA